MTKRGMFDMLYNPVLNNLSIHLTSIDQADSIILTCIILGKLMSYRLPSSYLTRSLVLDKLHVFVNTSVLSLNSFRDIE